MLNAGYVQCARLLGRGNRLDCPALRYNQHSEYKGRERESYILLSAKIFSLSLSPLCASVLPTGTCSLYLFEIDDDEKVGRNRILDYAVAVHVHVHRGIMCSSGTCTKQQ